MVDPFKFLKLNFRYLFLFFLFLSSCNKEEKNNQKDSTADWMSILIHKYPTTDINMLSVCMPGSHDAGMYLIQECSFGANTCNTQTQYLDMQHQLEAGLRIFDVRPIFYKNKYYTQHATDCDGLGCKGDLLGNMLDQTKAFLDSHAEIAILTMSHFCNMNGNDTAFLAFLEQKLGDKIYKDINPAQPLIHQPFKSILPSDLKTGKVILVFENGFGNTAENRALGYFTNSVLPTAGGWSNKDNFPELKADQLQKYSAYNPNGSRLFQFSWQMTQSTAQAVQCFFTPGGYSIHDMANTTNAALPAVIDSLIGSGEISRSKFPNTIWVDKGDALITRECQKINEIALQ